MLRQWLVLFCIPVILGKTPSTKKKIKVDKEHLKFDFTSIFGDLAAIFSDSEMDFRYFAAHDYDNNNKLDGLELYTALGHEINHNHSDVDNNEHSLSDLERQVDDIFEDHDSNNDGFLDYKEFMSVQREYPDIATGKS